MAKDQVVGAIILTVSVLVIVFYIWLFWVGLWFWALAVPVFIAVMGFLAIMAWIGWTMAKTPPPKPIESMESEKPSEEEPREEKAKTEAG